MTRPNAIYFDSLYAYIGTPGGYIIETCALRPGRYVKEDDGRQYPQICYGASRYGNTLIYSDPETLARDCRARIFKTRAGFDRAIKLMTDEYPE